MAKRARKSKLPGCIYEKRGRCYWKVKLPGEADSKARPLVTVGGRYATTTDRAVAEAVALETWQKAVFESDEARVSRADIPVNTYHGLLTVDGLKRGRSEAMEQFRDRNYRPGTKKPSDLGDRYTTQSYANGIRYAIKAAKKAGVEVEDFHPHQLRHTAATKVRREMGYECAGATLGHTNMSATQIYAERNQGLADEAAKRLG